MHFQLIVARLDLFPIQIVLCLLLRIIVKFDLPQNPWSQLTITLRIPRHQIQIVHNRLPIILLQLPRLPITNPQMQPPPPRKHKHHMPKPKILIHRPIEHMTRHPHQLPTEVAELCPFTARPHIIVVVDIDIQDELPLCGGVHDALLGDLLHDGSDVDFGWEFLEEHLAHLGGVAEGDVPFVDLLAVDVHGEVELAVAEEAVWVVVHVGEPGAD